MKQIAFVTLGAMLLLSAALLWARDQNMVNNSLVPAATGTVHTDTDRNGNTTVEVKVDHLAKPQDLNPPAQAYVVWAQPLNGTPTNIGELHVSDDLSGSLRATTPDQQFDLFITAEQNPRAQTPSNAQVLHTSISRK